MIRLLPQAAAAAAAQLQCLRLMAPSTLDTSRIKQGVGKDTYCPFLVIGQ